MGLPSPGSLSLSEALNYVVQCCGCSEREAKEALHRAAQGSLVKASGDIPLSAHPNPKIRDAHPVRKREALRAADWGDQVYWTTGKVGRYYSVTIERTSIEAWLAQTEEATSVQCAENELKRARSDMIDKTITAVYDEHKKIGKKPPNVKEIVAPVQEKLRTKGYQATGQEIQQIAEADKHKNRRRPPGKTVASEKSRD